jgi:hypothetical protein
MKEEIYETDEMTEEEMDDFLDYLEDLEDDFDIDEKYHPREDDDESEEDSDEDETLNNRKYEIIEKAKKSGLSVLKGNKENDMPLAPSSNGSTIKINNKNGGSVEIPKDVIFDGFSTLMNLGKELGYEFYKRQYYKNKYKKH